MRVHEKLTAEAIRIIRGEYVRYGRVGELAERFNVSPGSIWNAATGKTWANLENDAETLPGEEWRPAPDFEANYEVSSLGRVKRKQTQKVMKQATGTRGRRSVALSLNGAQRNVLVHRLVARAFIGEPPANMVVCHCNGDASDNRVDNLRWDTQSSNLLDRTAHGNDPRRNRDACKNGHIFTEENTIQLPTPTGFARACRVCKRANEKAGYRRRKEAAGALVQN